MRCDSCAVSLLLGMEMDSPRRGNIIYYCYLLIIIYKVDDNFSKDGHRSMHGESAYTVCMSSVSRRGKRY